MSSPSFPSLVIGKDSLRPQGAFATAQAEFLTPDQETLRKAAALLKERNVGVVAHFYMDPELQGVLSACEWPHIQISDSLAMADKAIAMVDAGVQAVVVLGVDFMSENVRAMLDAAGHNDVPVYRVATTPIGCSLAESAQTSAYQDWLDKAKETERSLHVVYINTSLLTKAQAHHTVPTITCTSSNVLQTILQAAAQVPDVHIWYGPDTYMGQNLASMLRSIGRMEDAQIAAIHPEHDRKSVASLSERFHYYEQGICIVHHMFGAEVTERVQREHPEAFVTAHLEVPGEMFSLGLEAQQQGRGVVGSTSNILQFIGDAVDRAVDGHGDTRLQFVLGTEAGMITSIVRSVQSKLASAGKNTSGEVTAEIVFPVASEAVAQTDDAELAIVPGVASGDGCSTAGGCATCPYMKMNSLDALLRVLTQLGTLPKHQLTSLHPKSYLELVGGRSAAEAGGEPILHMRDFQKHKRLSDPLVTDILTRRRTER